MVLPNPGRTHVPGRIQAIILARKITKRGVAKMRQGLRLHHGQAQGQSQASRITTIQFQCFNVSCFFPSLLKSNWAAANAGLRAVARGVGLWQGLSSMRRGPPGFSSHRFHFSFSDPKAAENGLQSPLSFNVSCDEWLFIIKVL